MKIALVTGATSGIGKAVAESLAEEGYNLIITGRRGELLNRVASNLESGGAKVLPLCFDVRSALEVKSNIGGLPAEWRNIDVLINNAGLAVGLNPINEGVVDDWERMIDTNVKGLLYVSRIVSNYMVQRRSGHIVNLCSIAGKETYMNGNVYCATKHAVAALTEGMRLDLLKYGIRVSQICPGAVETEFSEVRFKGDKEKAAKVYKGFEPLKAEDVAAAIMFMINCPQHVNINDMTIMPTAQANSTVFYKTPEDQ
ncbi:MAG: SDR family NAD(P)-dependent oxidoreductase [Bacteroidales bacterium]|jgi:NADP-dependent 3-hydroxy acid dehydrogenase YdfG|nr:SDR family NAD(P)-dependent oxidoreductase [Bacteroidales bacterium]MCI2145959.1 SDR family NAD(P)-dependent oxidoreductase [Bacteroidales bacterium]